VESYFSFAGESSYSLRRISCYAVSVFGRYYSLRNYLFPFHAKWYYLLLEACWGGDLAKRMELINWVLENMKNPNVQICQVMESKLNEIILKVNQSQDIFKSGKLHSEIQILARHWRYRSGLFELNLKLMGGCFTKYAADKPILPSD